jgi:hypothetical protein
MKCTLTYDAHFYEMHRYMYVHVQCNYYFTGGGTCTLKLSKPFKISQT